MPASTPGVRIRSTLYFDCFYGRLLDSRELTASVACCVDLCTRSYGNASIGSPVHVRLTDGSGVLQAGALQETCPVVHSNHSRDGATKHRYAMRECGGFNCRSTHRADRFPEFPPTGHATRRNGNQASLSDGMTTRGASGSIQLSDSSCGCRERDIPPRIEDTEKGWKRPLRTSSHNHGGPRDIGYIHDILRS